MGTVQIVNPCVFTRPQEQPLAPRHATLTGARVALLDNTKSNADVFLGHLAGVLQRQHGVTAVETFRKASGWVPVPAEMDARLRTFDALVTAFAD